MSAGGIYYRLEGGRFLYTGEVGTGGSPGDSTVCVTGAVDPTVTLALLHANGALPLPIAGRWTVTYAALLAAQVSGNRAVLSATSA
jgi:hypothetical protein